GRPHLRRRPAGATRRPRLARRPTPRHPPATRPPVGARPRGATLPTATLVARKAGSCARASGPSGFRQGDAALPLVLAAAVLVGDLALLVGLQEQHLRHPLVGVDFRRQR